MSVQDKDFGSPSFSFTPWLQPGDNSGVGVQEPF
jgi:hypothetical protein